MYLDSFFRYTKGEINMNYVYLKPELENLSQGERISFARQMRRMTQDEEYRKYIKNIIKTMKFTK